MTFIILLWVSCLLVNEFKLKCFKLQAPKANPSTTIAHPLRKSCRVFALWKHCVKDTKFPCPQQLCISHWLIQLCSLSFQAPYIHHMWVKLKQNSFLLLFLFFWNKRGSKPDFFFFFFKKNYFQADDILRWFKTSVPPAFWKELAELPIFEPGTPFPSPCLRVLWTRQINE